MRSRAGEIAKLARRVDRSTLGAMLAGFWVQGALVFTGILSARILGVDDRGHLALLWLIPLAIAAIGNLGLPLASTYFIAQDHARARPVVRSLAPIAALQLFAVILLQAAAMWIYLPGQSDHVVSSGLLTIPWAASIVMQLYGLALLQGQGRFRAFNVTRAIPMTLYSVTTIVVFIAGTGDLFVLTLAAMGASLVAGIATLSVGVARLPDARSGATAPPRSEMLSFGVKALLGSFSLVETLQVDQTFVGIVVSPQALGLYVVATSFTNLARFTVASVGMIAYPRIAEVSEQASARRRVWRYFVATVAGCAVLALVLELAVGWIVPFVFGDDFRPAVPIARILILGSVFLCARRILSDCVRGAGFPGLGTIAEVTSWAWLVPTLIVFSDQSGVRGAAWASASAYAFSLLLLLFLVFRRDRIRPAWASRLLRDRGLRGPGREEAALAMDLPLPDSPDAELVAQPVERGVENADARPARADE